MKVDDKIQYGQKNAQGELRFAVYHDKERKPYQASHIPSEEHNFEQEIDL